MIHGGMYREGYGIPSVPIYYPKVNKNEAVTEQW